jgi:hypothetical protein
LSLCPLNHLPNPRRRKVADAPFVKQPLQNLLESNGIQYEYLGRN